MTDAKISTVEQVQVLLAAAGTADERLIALRTYADLLKTDEGLLFLCDYLPQEEAVQTRHQILQFIIDQKSATLGNNPKYSELLFSLLVSEVESPIRHTAALGIAFMMPTKETLVPFAIEMLKDEGDFALHKIFCAALIDRPHIEDSLWPEILKYAKTSPLEMHPYVLELVSKAPKAEYKESVIVDMMRPTIPEATREQLVQQLLNIPTLSATVCESLGVKHLAQEPSLKIVTLIVGKIFSQSNLSGSVAQAVLNTIMARGAEALPLLTMFSFKMHSQPQILENFLAAASDPQTSTKTKLFILSIVRNTGMFQFWDLALKDSNPVIRSWAMQNSQNILEKHPQKFLEMILENYAKETSYFLRQQMLQLIVQHTSAMAAVSVDKWMNLFQEKDKFLLQKIAEISLHIPYDRSNKNMESLPQIWVELLGNTNLASDVQDQLLARVESIEFKGLPGLDKALRKILSEIRSMDQLSQYYPRIEKLVHDPKFILPQYVKLIEKFAGYYGQAPLPNMLKTIHALRGQVPEVAAKIPHLAAITQETWLISEATEQQQKDNLFTNIMDQLNLGDLSEAAKLIKAGYANSTLRKSEAIKIFKLGLAHPEMYEITQEMTSILKKVNVVTEDTVDWSFQFLSTFSAKNTSQYYVLEYLTTMGPQIPNYHEKYYKFLSQDAFLNFVRQNESPQKANGSLQNTRDWSDYEYWRVPYANWAMFDKLEEDQKIKWMREKLVEPFDKQIPLAWSVQQFALLCYHRHRKFKTEDFVALATLYKNVGEDQDLHFLKDRVACLYSEFWNRMWSEKEFNDETRKKLPQEIVDTATDIFLDQIYNWLDLGGMEYAGRVKPMFGVSLDRLQKTWKRDPAQWDLFWQGYTELFGVNGLKIIPPEPNNKRRESPKFQRIYGESGHGLREVFQFLFYTEPPSLEAVEYNKMWRKMIWTASKRNAELYARYLSEVDSATKQRLAEAAKAPAAG